MSILGAICALIAEKLGAPCGDDDVQNICNLPAHVQAPILDHCANHALLEDVANIVHLDAAETLERHDKLTASLWNQDVFPDPLVEECNLPCPYAFCLFGSHGHIYLLGNAGICVRNDVGGLMHYNFPDEPPFYAGAPRFRPTDAYIVAAMVLDTCDQYDTMWFLTSDAVAVHYAYHHTEKRLFKRLFTCLRAAGLPLTIGHRGYQCTVCPDNGAPMLYTQQDSQRYTQCFLGGTASTPDSYHSYTMDDLLQDPPLQQISWFIEKLTCSGEWYAAILRRRDSEDPINVENSMFLIAIRSTPPNNMFTALTHLEDGAIPLIHIVCALDVIVMASPTGELCVIDLETELVEADKTEYISEQSPVSLQEFDRDVPAPVDIQSSPSGLKLCVVSAVYLLHIYQWSPPHNVYVSIRLLDVYRGFIIGHTPRVLCAGEHLVTIDDNKVSFYRDSNATFLGDKQQQQTSDTPTLLVWNFGHCPTPAGATQ